MSDDESSSSSSSDSSSSSNSSSKGDTTAAAPVRIKVLPYSNNTPSDPILCSFPSGLPAALQDNKILELPSFVLKRSKDSITLVGKDKACYYAATLTDEEQDDLSVNYCVGVYDKQRQTVTFSQAMNGSVFALNQSVRNYQMHAESSTGSAEARMALFQDFGSSKKQKVLRSQAANRVNTETVLGSGRLMMDNVQQTMSESNKQAMLERKEAMQDNDDDDDGRRPTQSAAVQVASEAWRNSFLPPHDRDATEAYKVYRAKHIVGRVCWGQVSRVVDACVQQDNVARAIMVGKEERNGAKNSEDHNDGDEEFVGSATDRQRPAKHWYPSIEKLILSICNRPGETVDKAQLKAAILVNQFLTLYSALSKKRFISSLSTDQQSFLGTPFEYASYFLEKFCTSIVDLQGREGYVMSKADKDRCMVHMLILYIIADGGRSMRCTNLKPLLEDVKQDILDATQLLRQAGFTVERKSGSSLATASLKTPLTFPSSIRKGRK
jgi:hypothetical protein